VGTIGIGGAGMMLAIPDSSSGAASAAAMNPAITSGVAGSSSIPPTT
jgi:glycerol uptake facilitator-like aquaporin